MKHYLVLTPLILLSFTAFGNENTLEKDEALLIIGIYSSNITAIHFKEVDTGESFSVRRDISRVREPKPKRVKSGNYYLHSFSSFQNVVPVLFPSEPSDNSLLFKIDPESVNYLGEWVFDDASNATQTNYSMNIEYVAKWVHSYAKKNQGLEDLPLKVSFSNGTTKEFSW